jgi:AcrR family transcriptional regulator
VKLSKDERREQLLDVAMAIVREQGADQLSLVTLAARAGVSRPVAYEHFATRAGLLIALFRRLEDRYVQAIREAVQSAPPDLGAVAEMISNAYFNCHCHLGAEAPAISAALKGSEEMAHQQRIMINEYVEIMCLALQPFSSVRNEQLRLLCIALLGAAEAIAREMQIGRVPQAAAVGAFASLIVNSVGGARPLDIPRR